MEFVKSQRGKDLLVYKGFILKLIENLKKRLYGDATKLKTVQDEGIQCKVRLFLFLFFVFSYFENIDKKVYELLKKLR